MDMQTDKVNIVPRKKLISRDQDLLVTLPHLLLQVKVSCRRSLLACRLETKARCWFGEQKREITIVITVQMVTEVMTKERKTNNTLVADDSNCVKDRCNGSVPKAVKIKEKRNKQ